MLFGLSIMTNKRYYYAQPKNRFLDNYLVDLNVKKYIALHAFHALIMLHCSLPAKHYSAETCFFRILDQITTAWKFLVQL